MGTLHVRGTVRYAVPPGGNVVAANIKIWDLLGQNPGSPVYEGPATNGEFDGFAGIRNYTGPRLDGSGHWEAAYVNGYKVCDDCVWVPDQGEIPHVPLLQIEVTEGDLHTPDFPAAFPYFTPPDDALPPTPVLVPWGPAAVCLPQDDAHPHIRSFGLQIVRDLYPWKEVSSFDGAGGVVFDPPLPMADSLLPLGVPPPELPSPDYFGRRVVLQGQIAANRATNDAGLSSISNLSDYEDLYHFLPRPAVIESWTSDEKFAAQRLAGVNPAMLKKISAIPEKFGVMEPENERVLSSLIGEPLADALAGGRLYLLDYEILDGILAAHDPGDGRYLPAPYALFYACGGGNGAVQTVDTGGRTWNVADPKWKAADISGKLGDHHVTRAGGAFPIGGELGQQAGKARNGGANPREKSANLKRWAGVLKAAAIAKTADLERRAKRDPAGAAELETARKQVAELARFASQLGSAESALNDKLKEVNQAVSEGKAAYADKRQSLAESLRQKALAGREIAGSLITSTLELGLSGPLCNAGQELAAIAIQIDRDYDRVVNPVLMPVSMKEEWEVAKLMVQVADLNTHEMKYHLWNAHFAMEPFAVSMNRQLANNHPLRHLMRPHFYALIFNNHLGVGLLVNPGGGVDNLLGTKLSGSLEVMRRARQDWSFQQAGLRNDLRRRGLDDPATSLKDYPYRDDAMLVCEAIDAFVSEYADIYYTSDSKVTDDWELQNWLQELRDKQVAGIPVVRTVPALKEYVSQLIFTASAYHAAVNFSQYDFMAYIPNMPGAAFADPADKRHGVSWFLPPAQQTKDQLDLVSELSQFRNDKLADYPEFPDPLARAAADRFRSALDSVRNQIDQRNRDRRESLKYPYLYPELIPNSTSV